MSAQAFVDESGRGSKYHVCVVVVSNVDVDALRRLALYHGQGRDTEIRADGFRRMVQPLLDRGVTRLIIESREGRDELDRQVLVGQLRRRSYAFLYDHMPPHGDPLLWIADALAWCSSAGGRWHERIVGITESQDVSRA
jgi:hypothetical protein